MADEVVTPKILKAQSKLRQAILSTEVIKPTKKQSTESIVVLHPPSYKKQRTDLDLVVLHPPTFQEDKASSSSSSSSSGSKLQTISPILTPAALSHARKDSPSIEKLLASKEKKKTLSQLVRSADVENSVTNALDSQDNSKAIRAVPPSSSYTLSSVKSSAKNVAINNQVTRVLQDCTEIPPVSNTAETQASTSSAADSKYSKTVTYVVTPKLSTNNAEGGAASAPVRKVQAMRPIPLSERPVPFAGNQFCPPEPLPAPRKRKEPARGYSEVSVSKTASLSLESLHQLSPNLSLAATLKCPRCTGRKLKNSSTQTSDVSGYAAESTEARVRAALSANSGLNWRFQIIKDAEEARESILQHEIENTVQYIITGDKYTGFNREALVSRKSFGIRWELKGLKSAHGSLLVPFTGVPFITGHSNTVQTCINGNDRLAPKRRAERALLKQIAESGHQLDRSLHPSYKVGCPAQVVIKELVYFPDYQVKDTKTQAGMRRLASNLLVALRSKDPTLKWFTVIFLSLPSVQEHSGHPIGEAAGPTQKLDRAIIRYIKEAVRAGATKVKEVMTHIEMFRKSTFGDNPPPAYSRRWYPTSKRVLSHIVRERHKLQMEQYLTHQKVPDAITAASTSTAAENIVWIVPSDNGSATISTEADLAVGSIITTSEPTQQMFSRTNQPGSSSGIKVVRKLKKRLDLSKYDHRLPASEDDHTQIKSMLEKLYNQIPEIPSKAWCEEVLRNVKQLSKSTSRHITSQTKRKQRELMTTTEVQVVEVMEDSAVTHLQQLMGE